MTLDFIRMLCANPYLFEQTLLTAAELVRGSLLGLARLLTSRCQQPGPMIAPL